MDTDSASSTSYLLNFFRSSPNSLSSPFWKPTWSPTSRAFTPSLPLLLTILLRRTCTFYFLLEVGASHTPSLCMVVIHCSFIMVDLSSLQVHADPPPPNIPLLFLSSTAINTSCYFSSFLQKGGGGGKRCRGILLQYSSYSFGFFPSLLPFFGDVENEEQTEWMLQQQWRREGSHSCLPRCYSDISRYFYKCM